MTRPNHVEMWDVELPLRRPLVTAQGDHTTRRSILVRVAREGVEGWGEAAPVPGHTIDDADEAWEVLGIEAGRLLAGDDPVLIDGSCATAALDAALTAWRAASLGIPMAVQVGGAPEPIVASAAIGVAADESALLTNVDEAVAVGHRHVKLKITPDHLDAPATVRRRFPELGIAVDANGSFHRRHLDELADLDDLGLTYIEQPLGRLDLAGHATLRTRSTTPICLDESVRRLGDIVTIATARAATAVSIKPGRLGPTLAQRALTLAARHELEVKIGGLVSTGIGKAHDIALATHPQVTLPSDLAASGHWFTEDVVDPPWLIHDGSLVPSPDPGLGIAVSRSRIEAASRRHLRLPG